jgi:ribosomal protein S8
LAFPAVQFGVIVLTTSAGIMVNPAVCRQLPVICNVFQSRTSTWVCSFYVLILSLLHIQDHEEARRKKVGGKVLGFFY